ncbi:hypothetical protein ACFZDG_33005 [Kitasatospora xanthocidica]|uniref:hypothetical protein n=1 Tax=Kitasatospora xanthocidica TaxID=83382 RepID=UPI0036E4AE19
MTVTNDAPDHPTPAPAPAPAPTQDWWQHIEDRLAAIELRIREQSTAARTALDTHLARLDALSRRLATRPWPPHGPDTPGSPAPPPCTPAGEARCRTRRPAPGADPPPR